MLSSFTFLQRGSNGVAEARIPLKIYIMIFAQPKYKCLTGLRKERQTAKQMIFCVGNGELARRLTNIKNNRSKLLVVVHILTKGLERRSRSANTFENKYYVIRATQIQMPDGITDGTTDCEADDFLCRQWRACTPIDKHKKNSRSKKLRLSFKKKRQSQKIAAFSVIPPGLEPGTPTLKVLCSTC